MHVNTHVEAHMHESMQAWTHPLTHSTVIIPIVNNRCKVEKEILLSSSSFSSDGGFDKFDSKQHVLLKYVLLL